jgi:hypothetical protein
MLTDRGVGLGWHDARAPNRLDPRAHGLDRGRHMSHNAADSAAMMRKEPSRALVGLAPDLPDGDLHRRVAGCLNRNCGRSRKAKNPRFPGGFEW